MIHIECSLPIRVFDEIILASEMEVRVYPMADTCFSWGHCDDVFIRDVMGNWRRLPSPWDLQVLAEIARTDPATYEEIRLARIENAQGSEAA
jgi:hypothetical protein